MFAHHWRKKLRIACWGIGVLALLIGVPLRAPAELVRFPMTIELELIRSLIVAQAYNGPEEMARVVSMNQGCNEIRLTKPRLTEDRGVIRFQTDVHITWGTPIAGTCFTPLYWSGSIVLWQQPVIDSKWQLRFNTLNSSMLDNSGSPASLPGMIWDLVKNNIHNYLNSIVINLAPPVDNLKQFMVPQATPKPLSPAERFLASMRPDIPQVRGNSLLIDILAEADIPRTQQGNEEIPAIESPQQQARLMALWQTWDALLVHIISQVSTKVLTEDDRQLLLDTLLRVRYEFSDVIGTPELTSAFVRHQFISAWRALKPLFYNHLAPNPADNPLGYLSFFTAADALVTLDRIGPLIGIDISREGFYRLAHMLSAGTPLNEGEAVDQRLRDTLGLESVMPPLPEEDPVQSEESSVPAETPAPAEGPMQSEESEPDSIPEDINPVLPDQEESAPLLNDSGSGIFNRLDRQLSRLSGKLFLGPAEACAATAPTLKEVQRWTAEMTPAEELLTRVREVLVKAATAQKKRLDIPAGTSGWGEKMIQATAWQESCFRQFVVKDKKITYLLSYNNTSVGVMQINEKVWRGIYDLQKLRWNIAYNSAAGSEILALYLNRYLAKKHNASHFNDASGRRYMATWLYALYNGGPGQLKKFPERNTAGKLYKSEKLFQEKYDKVVDQHWFQQVDCLPVR